MVTALYCPSTAILEKRAVVFGLRGGAVLNSVEWRERASSEGLFENPRKRVSRWRLRCPTGVSGAAVTLYCTSPYLFIQPVTPLKRAVCLTECTDGAVGHKEHGGKYTSVFSEAIVFCVCTSERILEPRVASNVRTLGIKVETAANFSEQSRSCASESTASLFCKTRSYVLQ